MLLFRHNVGTYQETSSHTFVREHLATVISACWANVDWSWLLRSEICVQDLISTKTRRQGMNCQTYSQNSCTWGKSHHQWKKSAFLLLFCLALWSTSWLLTFCCTRRKHDWQSGAFSWYERRVSLCNQRTCQNGADILSVYDNIRTDVPFLSFLFPTVYLLWDCSTKGISISLPRQVGFWTRTHAMFRSKWVPHR